MQHSTSIEDLSLDYIPTHNSTSSSSASLNAHHNPQRNSNSSSNSNIPHLIATNAANVAARSTNQTSRTVRSHWVRYTSDNWRHISRTSKLMLIFSITSVIVQFIATVVVLIISRSQYCDKPLQVILIVYILRLILSTPLSIYQHLNPHYRRRPPPRRNNNNSANLEMGTNVGSTHNTNSYPSTLPPQSTDTATPSAAQAHYDALAGWIDRAKSALDLFAILWFIIMNWLLFSSSTCSSTAPSLYYLTLMFIVFGYIIITIPILLCAAVIFCLPCVLVGMRVLRVGEVVGMGGASAEDIKNIPVKRYRSRTSRPLDQDDNSITIAPSTSVQQPQQPETAAQLATKVGIFTKFMMKTRPKGKDAEPQDVRFYEPFEIPNSEDAMCAICLSAYEDDELVCHLWCGHHFHKGCVHEWLGLNRRCPLCKRDVRGKDFDEQED